MEVTQSIILFKRMITAIFPTLALLLGIVIVMTLLLALYRHLVQGQYSQERIDGDSKRIIAELNTTVNFQVKEIQRLTDRNNALEVAKHRTAEMWSKL